MAVSSGFFNSVNHDRLYDSEQISSIFDGIIVDGVYENYGEAFNVTAYADVENTVIIGTGRAWFDHTWTYNDSQFSITLDPANDMLSRVDAIVIDVNREQATRANSIIYIKGSEASPDMPPELIKTELHNQYPICYITRTAGSAGAIQQSDIEITVGTAACPIVTGVLEAQNLSNLMQQLNDEFYEWWDGVKATLDENVVTHLQNQIDEINAKLDSDDATVGLLEKPIADIYMNNSYDVTVSSYTYESNILGEVNGNKYRSLVTFLPDGKLLKVKSYVDTSGTVKKKGVVIYIYNTDGVLAVNKTLYSNKVGTLINDGVDDDYSPESGTVNQTETYWMNVNVDSYPVSFDVLRQWGAMERSMGFENKPIRHYIFREHYTIGSTGTIQVSYSDIQTYDSSIWSAGGGDSSRYSSFNSTGYAFVGTSPTSSGSTITMLIGGDASRNTSFVGVAKVDKSGVITGKPFVSNSFYSSMDFDNFENATDNDNIAPNFLYGSEGCAIAYKDSTHWIMVSESTLGITTHNGDQACPYTIGEIVETPFSLYTLKGQTGFYSTGNTAGEYNSLSEKKLIDKAFIGASNSGNPIYTGDVVAIEDNGRYVGIDGDSYYFAIGTNGGIAVSNSKASSFTKPDSSSMRISFVPFINTPTLTGYLQSNYKVILIKKS